MAAEDDSESIVSRGASASIATGAISNANQHPKLVAYCI
jgi:hypothetical protein